MKYNLKFLLEAAEEAMDTCSYNLIKECMAELREMPCLKLGNKTVHAHGEPQCHGYCVIKQILGESDKEILGE